MQEDFFQVADLTLNAQTKEVYRASQLLTLTPQEFMLLAYLMKHHGKIVTRQQILSHIWQFTPEMESRVVDVYIGYLRKKIDRHFSPPLIHSVRGFGYVMKG